MCETCLMTYAKVSKVDPTRTTTLRNAFVRDCRKRFTRLANNITRLIGKENQFGLLVNAGQFDFPTSQDKVESFMQWLHGQIDMYNLEISSANQVGVGLNDYWTNKYVTDSYRRGVIRARQEMRKAGLDVPSIDTTGGIGASMTSPIHLDRLGILYTRTFNELKNITQAMSGQISRVLTQGLADGDNPRLLARKLVAVINGGGAELGLDISYINKAGKQINYFMPAKRRAEILARTEIIRAHHMGMVQEYRNWGLEGVKVQAEWKTAGDDRVCDICAGMEGNTYTLDEIEKMIPAHPQCRCIALPSVVEEEKKGSNTKEFEKNILSYESSKKYDLKESAAVYNNSGELLFAKKGTKNSVSFNFEEQSQISGNILTHNHPALKGYNHDVSFSIQDIAVFLKLELKEIRASGQQGVFSISKKTGVTYSTKQVKQVTRRFNMYMKHERQLNSIEYTQGKKTKQQFENFDLFDAVNKRMADFFDYEYKYKKYGTN